MSLHRYYKTIFSMDSVIDLTLSFLSSFGVLALFLGVFDILWPNKFEFGWGGLWSMVIMSLISAIILSRPKRQFHKVFSVPDMKITIKVGDIFEESSNLIIGFNDVFDTEIGSVISAASLQGKFLTNFYNNDRPRLDRDIDTALTSVQGVVDPAKTTGKNKRYPLGTVAVLQGDKNTYFCTAYSRMGTDLVASSDINDIWQSLSKLWETIRLKGSCQQVSMPIIGSDLARVAGVSHSALVKLILMSFVIHSRVKIITKDFRLIIHEGNVGKVNLKSTEKFLNDL